MHLHKTAFFILIASVCSVVFLFSHAPSAHACSCIAPGTPQEMLETSSAVFAGTAVDVESGGSSNDITFDVEKIWKGISTEQVTVTTGRGGGDCGFEFTEGEKYIVYTYGDPLTVNICSRTQLVSEGGSDVVALGAWTTPTETESKKGASTKELATILVSIIVTAVVLASVKEVFAWLRKKHA